MSRSWSGGGGGERAPGPDDEADKENLDPREASLYAGPTQVKYRKEVAKTGHADLRAHPATPFCVTPVDEARAVVCMLEVDSLTALLRTACLGASMLGTLASLLDSVEVASSLPWLREPERFSGTWAMLEAMRLQGVPVLTEVTHKSMAAQWKRIQPHFHAGSPMLVVDRERNVLCIARPVGTPVYVAAGEAGWIPSRWKRPEAADSVEMWVALACVPAPDTTRARDWLRPETCKYVRELNWANLGTSAGLRVLPSVGVSVPARPADPPPDLPPAPLIPRPPCAPRHRRNRWASCSWTGACGTCTTCWWTTSRSGSPTCGAHQSRRSGARRSDGATPAPRR
jgi:hypothetical protein